MYFLLLFASCLLQDNRFLVVVCFQKDEPDAFEELGTGNRIATWLLYVSSRQFESLLNSVLLK